MTTAEITPAMVKALREKSGAGMMDCKKALAETGGDEDAALKILREKGVAAAGKLSSRATTEGRVETYVHGDGRIGVMVEVGCNTDFVARNDDFQGFARDLAMHIAAMSPRWVSREEVPADVIEAEKDLFRKQAADKPENVRDKIAEGKLDKWYSEVCLLDQPWIRAREKYDRDMTIDELRTEMVQQTGENIEIRRFARYELGGE